MISRVFRKTAFLTQQEMEPGTPIPSTLSINPLLQLLKLRIAGIVVRLV